LSVTHRYRAPAEEGILSFPPETEIGPQLARNSDRLNRRDILIDGCPLPQFRDEARREVLTAARQYLAESGQPLPGPVDGPIFMSGHQPELTHVGVLVKTFALNGMAERHGRIPLNLIVDNDTTKNTHLRFAVLNRDANRPWDPAGVHLQTVPYDRYEGEITYEQRAVVDPGLFHSFVERAEPLTRDWGFKPLLPEMWQQMRTQYARTPILGQIVSATRRHYERRWGCNNLEIPLSRLCATNAFQRFVRHITGDIARFHRIYNEAVAEYRERNHVRSRNHPVPDLAEDHDTYEAPFWRMRSGGERRARLMVKPGDVPTGPDLRSRALTTTMFLRLILSDGFIHGIGGAKYDEVTDAIIERWLGIEPPEIIVVTATFRLPLPTFPTTPEELHQAERRLRDLHWNPQRYLDSATMETVAGAATKRLLIELRPAAKADRKRWFRQLAKATASLRPHAVGNLAHATANLDDCRRGMRANEALIRRDFAWCLFPEELISRFCGNVQAGR